MSLQSGYHTLSKLDSSTPHRFLEPSKHINDGEQDLPFFHTSYAYCDIITFLLQLNLSMFPQKSPSSSSPTTFSLKASSIQLSPAVQNLQTLLSRISSIIDETPPDPGPRRFGNMSFRRWYDKTAERLPALLKQYLLPDVLDFPADPSTGVLARDELQAYLLGSFGSAQRLDYGTGHELSFLAFLGCVWKLGGFEKVEPGVEERGIVVGVIEPYLQLIRRLIMTYTLEPAGSHGVWGLDDHSFLPYIFGSAQLAAPVPPLSSEFTPDQIPQEGSLPGAPSPSDVTRKEAVQREREDNMYFSAIGFIYDVKKGPFWEHSPILFDISGITTGWAKANKGLLKMYNVEVLSKFPVVQHFPFGSLFRWEKDPHAPSPPPSACSTNQPTRAPAVASATNIPPERRRFNNPLAGRATTSPDAMGAAVRSRAPPIGRPPGMGSQRPMASVPQVYAAQFMQTQQMPSAGVPRADPYPASPMMAQEMAMQQQQNLASRSMPGTQAPWTRQHVDGTTVPSQATRASPAGKEAGGMAPTGAPWADGSLPKG